MSRRKPSVKKVCAVCGREFETAREAHYTCSPECSRELNRRKIHERYMKLRSVSPRRRPVHSRIIEGVTHERMAEIAYAQDSGDVRKLAEFAKTWTPAERKWAKRRYCEMNQLNRWY